MSSRNGERLFSDKTIWLSPLALELWIYSSNVSKPFDEILAVGYVFLPFSSNDISFQVYQDSIYLGSGSIPDGLYLPKYDTSLVSIFFNFDKRQLHMMSTLSDSLNLTIIGRAEISYMQSDY